MDVTQDMSVDELRREVRRLWDLQRDVINALSEAPEVPPPHVLRFLSKAAKFPEDAGRGRQMQYEHGFDAIPLRVEYELGAGLWSRILAGLKVSDTEGEPT